MRYTDLFGQSYPKLSLILQNHYSLILKIVLLAANKQNKYYSIIFVPK